MSNEAILTFHPLNGSAVKKCLPLSHISPELSSNQDYKYSVFESGKYSVKAKFDTTALCNILKELYAQQEKQQQAPVSVSADDTFFEEDSDGETFLKDAVSDTLINKYFNAAENVESKPIYTEKESLPDIADIINQQLQFAVEVNGKRCGLFKYIEDDSTDSGIFTCDFDLFDPIQPKGRHANFIFKTYYDSVVISFVIWSTGQPDKRFRLYTPWLACTTGKEDISNIKNIINELTNFSSGELQHFIFRRRKKRFSGIFTDDNTSCNSLSGYIFLINRICQVYEKHINFFRKSPASKVVKETVITSSNRVKQVRFSDFVWLSRHSEELRKTRYGGVLNINGESYTPVRMRTQELIKTKNTPENMAVLSFLYTVSGHIGQVRNRFDEIISEQRSIPQSTKAEQEDLTSAPFLSWKMLTIETLEKHLNELKELHIKIKALYTACKNSLGLEDQPLTYLPYRTKIFCELTPYAEIYTVMKLFFTKGNLMPEYCSPFVNIKKLDRLFEYYCLYALLNMFLNRGYSIDIKNSGFFSYSAVTNGKVETDHEVRNTFRLRSDKAEATLYYQPVIYSYRFENGIRIFRNTESNNFYTPDFVIRIKDLTTEDSADDYLIFDAKFSSGDAIQNTYMRDLIRKYYTEITTVKVHGLSDPTHIDSENTEPVVQDIKITTGNIRMVMALQGRLESENGEEKTLIRYWNSPLAAQIQPQLYAGILKLNTAVNATGELWSAIESCLPYLKDNKDNA